MRKRPYGSKLSPPPTKNNPPTPPQPPRLLSSKRGKLKISRLLRQEAWRGGETNVPVGRPRPVRRPNDSDPYGNRLHKFHYTFVFVPIENREPLRERLDQENEQTLGQVGKGLSKGCRVSYSGMTYNSASDQIIVKVNMLKTE